MGKHYALAREAIIAALTAYTGITTADGATPANNTLICSDLIDKNDFISEKTILIGSGDADNEDSGASSFVSGTGVITVTSAFSAQIKKGTIFRVLNISSVEIDVASMNTKIGTNTDAVGTTTLFARLRQIVDTYLAALVGTTGIFNEQADAGISVSIAAAETFIVTLTTADTRYILRNLRVKSPDPGAGNTITVTLYELINSAEVAVDTFVISQANFTTYFSLMDMFGLPHIAGDSIRVSLTGLLAGPIVVTGQYSHGKTNV